ncbi:purine nucleoside phosphorylase LACC1 [Osmerus mordax]|uniref:purine nucleoside phosphorylase LACC1 n=1 Tax=Osmerus mordax TaxID=8014 RepID=UPI00350F60D2
MSTIFVVDLISFPCSNYTDSLEKQIDGVRTALAEETDGTIYILTGPHYERVNSPNGTKHATLLDTVSYGNRNVEVLNFSTVAECLYRFKLAVDELEFKSIKVITSEPGVALLQLYQEQLFTALYTFEYVAVGDLTDVPTVTPLSDVKQEVSSFLQQLPAVKGDVTILRSTLISDCFSHGFSTRQGGISTIDTLSSLNLFSSSRRRDPQGVVSENVRRLAVTAGFYPRRLHMVKVNHGNDVWVMGKNEPESYDGIVTNQRGVVIAAPGADCMPLLFVDPVLKVIGAAHAGWKGTLMGVAMATVNAMVEGFGSNVRDVRAVIGPSVGLCCFSWKKEEALEFLDIHPSCVLNPDADKPHINIQLATRLLLQKGGVLPEHIHDNTVTDRPSVTLCTACHPESFFSHVRDGLNFGTQIGFLWIKETERTGRDRD